jgi:hypothetical protein
MHTRQALLRSTNIITRRFTTGSNGFITRSIPKHSMFSNVRRSYTTDAIVPVEENEDNSNISTPGIIAD